jgi:amino acid transporter
MAAQSLERRLGPVDAAVLVIANVIGVGIFATPGFVATIVPNAFAIAGVWVAGGVLAFFGALAYAELAARRPLAGGEYVYLRESFGGAAGFLAGWTSFVAGFSGAIAAGAMRITVYADRFFRGVAESKTVPSQSSPCSRRCTCADSVPAGQSRRYSRSSKSRPSCGSSSLAWPSAVRQSRPRPPMDQ